MKRLKVIALGVILMASTACATRSGDDLDVAGLVENATDTTLATGADGTGAAAIGDAGDPSNADGGDGGGASGGGRGTSGRAGGRTSGPGATVVGQRGSSSGGVASKGGTIRIGVHTSANLQTAYAAFGAQGAEGDLTPAIQKVVDWINKNGGMGGRQVEALFHASDPLNGNFDALAQRMCEDFAERRAAAVVSGAVLPTIVTPDCMAKKGIPLVWNYHYLLDEPTWQKYRPNLYVPFSMTAERIGPAYVDQLAAGGYFGGATVGIVRYDNPQHQRFSAAILRPALTARGMKVAEEIAVTQPPNAAAAGDTASQLGSGILRLRQAGVDHVMFVPTGGAVPFLFMSEAEGQGYRPRYAMTTLDIPSFVNDQAQPAQLRGSLVVGWSPGGDVYRPQEPPSPPRELCYKLTESRGAHRFCDGLLFLKAALDRSGSPDPAGLRAGVEGLAGHFDPVWSLRTSFDPGRHDGANAVRLAAYEDACDCFKYTGPLTSVP